MKQKRFILLLVANLLLGLICVISVFHVERPTQIAVVNVNAIVDHYVKTMAHSQLEEALIEKNTEQFIKQLEVELDKIAKEKKVTLFLSEAVLTPSIDLTDLVQKRTEQHISKGKLKNGLR